MLAVRIIGIENRDISESLSSKVIDFSKGQRRPSDVNRAWHVMASPALATAGIVKSIKDSGKSIIVTISPLSVRLVISNKMLSASEPLRVYSRMAGEMTTGYVESGSATTLAVTSTYDMISSVPLAVTISGCLMTGPLNNLVAKFVTNATLSPGGMMSLSKGAKALAQPGRKSSITRVSLPVECNQKV